MRIHSNLVLSAVFTIATTGGAHAAGAVSVVSDGSGGVNITGDAEDNKLKISDTDGNFDWTITGSGGTLVNGMKSVQTGVLTGQMSITLGAGDDSIKMYDGTLLGRLYSVTGTGNDKTSYSDLSVGDYVHFEGNADDDQIKIKSLIVVDPPNTYYSSIDTDDFGGGATGIDKLKIKGITDQDIVVTLGGGNDKAGVQEVAASDFLSLNAGSETDKVTVKSVTTGDLQMETGAGDGDILKVLSCTAPLYTFSDSAGTGDVIVENNNTLGAGISMGFGD